MSKTDDAREAARLRAEDRKRHNRLYYVDAAPERSPAPAIVTCSSKRLEAIEAAHPDLVTPDSPTQRVGGQPFESFATVCSRRADALDRQYL